MGLGRLRGAAWGGHTSALSQVGSTVGEGSVGGCDGAHWAGVMKSCGDYFRFLLYNQLGFGCYVAISPRRFRSISV